MHYKDKKLAFNVRNYKGFSKPMPSSFSINYLFKLKLYYTQIKSNRRYFLIVLVVLLIVYFYQLNYSNYSENILEELNGQSEYDYIMNKYKSLKEKNEINAANDGINSIISGDYSKVESSLIIDALVKQDDEKKPLYTLVTEFINGIYIYNMNEPIESWWPFECVQTKMKQSINTKLCIHDPKFDKHISAQLKENGLWEPTNVRSFLKQLREEPEANVMDIGANIGLYTLLSAKLNRTVIAVEPLHENLNRMHKAAQLEHVENRIIALVNAVSNERKPLKVSIVDNNIGGSYVLQPEIIDKQQKYSLTSSSVIVNSILLDDLVDVFKLKVLKSNKSMSKKFVVKLDIEGYEPFVFEQSKNFFESLEIVAIFMEWGKMMEKLENLGQNESDSELKSSYLNKIKSMIRKLQGLNYEPYEVNGFNKLEYNKWEKEWPWDVFFRNCDLTNCPGHVYKLSGV